MLGDQGDAGCLNLYPGTFGFLPSADLQEGTFLGSVLTYILQVLWFFSNWNLQETEEKFQHKSVKKK